MQEDRIRKHYEPRIDPNAESFEIADWGDAASQTKRFEALIELVAENPDGVGRHASDTTSAGIIAPSVPSAGVAPSWCRPGIGANSPLPWPPPHPVARS